MDKKKMKTELLFLLEPVASVGMLLPSLERCYYMHENHIFEKKN